MPCIFFFFLVTKTEPLCDKASLDVALQTVAAFAVVSGVAALILLFIDLVAFVFVLRYKRPLISPHDRCCRVS